MEGCITFYLYYCLMSKKRSHELPSIFICCQLLLQVNPREVFTRIELHFIPGPLPHPPAAHSSVSASSVAAVAAAAAGIHNRGPGNIMARYNNIPVTTSYSTVTLASAISNTPRLAHSQNGTGPPIQHPTSRYYTTRDQ